MTASEGSATTAEESAATAEESATSTAQEPGVLRSWLAEVRADRRARWAGLAGGAAVGLAVAWVHWYGFLVGGALVGLVSTDWKRGLVAGVGFGLLAWAVFVGLLASNGAFWQYAGTGRLLYLSVGIPVVGGALGSLVRGVV